MKRVCLLLAPGFEEIEAVTVADVLRRAGVDLRLVGVGALHVRGAHGIVVRADVALGDAAAEEWDLVVLPGGLPGATNLRDDPEVQRFLAEHAAEGEVAAICAAPIALGRAGLLEGRRATCYPGFEDGLGGAEVAEAAVVEDGPVVTSRGPGTALPFALTLVERLVGADKAAELRRGMLVDLGAAWAAGE